MEEKAEKQQTKERERDEARRAETPQSHIEEGVAENIPRTERSDSEMDTFQS